jgi:hypothetical protein
MSAWLQSLMPPVSSPEIHAAVRVAQAMLHLANITGNLSMHRNAESVMRRALCTLESMGTMSEAQPLMAELSETLRQMDADILEDAEEKETASHILAMRERSFRLSHAASQAFESSDLENAHNLAGMATEDLLSVLAYLRRNEPQEVLEEIASQLAAQGITDPVEQREMIQRAREAILFPPLNLSLRILYCCALEQAGRSPLEAVDTLMPLSELLYRTNPSSVGILLAHALALIDRAGALALQAEDKSLDEAEQCLRRADQVLEGVKEPHANDDGWIRYYDRQLDGTLQAINQGSAAIESGFQTELLKLRSHFEAVAGRFRDRIQKPD